MSYKKLLDKIWTSYAEITPQATQIQTLLKSNKVGETAIHNDHIAYRTWGTSKLGINSVSKFFKNYDYEAIQDYDMPEKNIFAVHMEHKYDIEAPKIFISELKLHNLSKFAQETAQMCTNSIPEADYNKEDFLTSGSKYWSPLQYKKYSQLLEESEYAAWLYCYGICCNHFTVLINKMSNPTYSQSLANLNSFLKSEGFKLNSSGGEIKGTPNELLEQSSTIASKKVVNFAEGSHEVPSCYYEFAKRYPISMDAPEKLYSGFVPSSATKIFESTNAKM